MHHVYSSLQNTLQYSFKDHLGALQVEKLLESCMSLASGEPASTSRCFEGVPSLQLTLPQSLVLQACLPAERHTSPELQKGPLVMLTYAQFCASDALFNAQSLGTLLPTSNARNLQKLKST